MKAHPILMTAPEVRASLAGTKTQTHRVMLRPPSGEHLITFDHESGEWYEDGGVWHARCPYGVPGDRLWVRETWTQPDPYDRRTLCYRASGDPVTTGAAWRPSIHMPQWASRITLEVTDVRVQRLQDISEAEAMAEGVPVDQRAPADREHPSRICVRCGKHADTHVGIARVCFGSTGDVFSNWTYRGGFRALWDERYGKSAPWSSNPWVWAITFRLVTGPGTSQRSAMMGAEPDIVETVDVPF